MEDVNMTDVTAEETSNSESISKQLPAQEMSQTPSTASVSSTTSSSTPAKRKRKKANMACVYCRRSHMVCSSERPCTRCIQRSIAHLCHDEPVNGAGQATGATSKKAKVDVEQPLAQPQISQPQTQVTQPQQEPLQLQNTSAASTNSNISGRGHHSLLDFQTSNINGNSGSNQMSYLNRPMNNNNQQNTNLNLINNNNNSSAPATNSLFNATDPTTASLFQQPYFFSEHAGSEFSSLNEFLSMLDDPQLDMSGQQPQQQNVQGLGTTTPGQGQGQGLGLGSGLSSLNLNALFAQQQSQQNLPQQGQPNPNNQNNGVSLSTSHSLTNLVGFNLNSPSLSHLNLAGLASIYNQQNPNPNPNQPQQHPSLNSNTSGFKNLLQDPTNTQHRPFQPQTDQLSSFGQHQPNAQQHQYLGPLTSTTTNVTISDSARDKFFLTAADPSGIDSLTPEDRLKQVINAKLEAGLLQPYNYAKGYARLQGYMDNYMNQSSKQRILKPLSIFRPAFRGIARTLKDVDLILVEENFERMLLDYDRVFTSMAIPACLWRRTGEIYRGNKEFASLVEVNSDDLKDGKLTIYELMSEESAVNYWEKYGDVAFDNRQKAVLTSCNLRTRDGRKRKSCCFSFTVRRDRYDIPSCIVGNFIPINP